MNDLTFNKAEIELLHNVLELNPVQIVWDINAFYFNSPATTYKLECFSERPTGSAYEYDEIFYCRFQKLREHLVFEEERPGYWYKIITNDCKIIDIKYVNVIELFPNNKVISNQSAGRSEPGLNKSTLGLIMETSKGFLPSFILPSTHGFTWQPKMKFYSKNEIETLLSENITYYEILSCS